MTSVVTPAERGRRWYIGMVAKYGEKQMAEWRKLGGRKKNPTLAEILAAPVKPTRSKRRAR